jgi:uncharacterized damage-inducible protein DinB
MPMDALLPYRAMAHNNAWANHRLLRACATLSLEEFTARRAGFFPSLRATLNHILIVDRFYVDATEGGALGPAAWADREPCGSVAELRQAQAEMDRRCSPSSAARTRRASVGSSPCIAPPACSTSGWTGCCICSSIKSTTAARLTRC